ncbi:MAG: MFS transporter, partial [Candidatus Rokuibacteriota bacterium]
LAQALVGAVGWRGTLLVWAALLVVVVVPVSALQRLPEGAFPIPPGTSPPPAAWTLRLALRSRAFWWLGTTRFFAAFAFPLLNTHMVAFAIGQGVSPAMAAAALGSVSLVSLVGRLTTGWLSDRLGRALTLTLMYASAGLGIGCLVLLAATGSLGWLALYVLFYGMAQGSSGIVASARAADVFAGASFGAIYGWLTLALGPGEALGAWIGGMIFDVTGSYLGAFGLAGAALAAGVVAIWRVKPDPRRSTYSSIS